MTLSRPHLIFSANLGDHPSQGLDVLLKLLHLVHVLPEQCKRHLYIQYSSTFLLFIEHLSATLSGAPPIGVLTLLLIPPPGLRRTLIALGLPLTKANGQMGKLAYLGVGAMFGEGTGLPPG